MLFDQRGCGKSTPHASLEENTTWHLVADMEQLREHLGIERWQVFGGSWGSTLALAYAETHPERVTELVLRGIFLLRKQEIDWFYQRGASAIFPDAGRTYLGAHPASRARRPRPGLPPAAHEPQSRDAAQGGARPGASGKAARAACSSTKPTSTNWEADEFAIAFARIECHYFVNRGFFEREDQLLRNVPAHPPYPGASSCRAATTSSAPMRSAWALHRAWPEADLRIVPDAGHSAIEPGITHELVAATDRFAK